MNRPGTGAIGLKRWWNDRLESAQEWKVTIKTLGNLYSEVEAAIRSIHSYDEPEILAVPITNVSAGYRAWLLAQLAIPVKKPAGDKLTESTISKSKKKS